MASLRQRIYWKMPYFMRCWMASRYGRSRDRTRFGEVYQERLAEIAEHDQWSPDQFPGYQAQRLAKVVQHAATHVPYYRRTFAECGLDPTSITSVDDLRRLPILEKEPLRANSVDFVDERLNVSDLILHHTSGTTGTPMLLYRDVRQDSIAFAFLDGRCHDVAGVRRRRNRSVSIGGHPVASPRRTRPPFWVENKRWNQLYLSSYHLSPQYLDHYVQAIRDFKPDYIEGYPSSVYAIAHHVVERKLPPLALKAAFTTGETLYEHQRQDIREAFGCKTFNQYGCGEMAFFAAECDHGSMHISPEIGIIEILDDDDQPVPAGEAGNVVCTSLVNFVQPFIRYRIGDVAALKPGTCPCGRQLPLLDRIEGRTDDVIVTPDGRRMGLAHLSLLFYDLEGILETQIVQDDLDTFRLRIVTSDDYKDSDGQMLVDSFAQRVGEVAIQLERVAEIPRTARGKYRMILSNIPKDGKP